MLTMLAGNAFCPCCAFGFSPPPRRRLAAGRASGFACTVPTAASAGAGSEANSRLGQARPLCIEGGTVVDPRDGSLVADATVIVDRGRIVGVGTNGSAAGPSADRIDARGKYVVPGYNDMHSHVLELDDPSGALALMLAEGVTGLRQMSGSPQRLAERRNGTLPVGRDAPAALEMPGTVLTPLNAGSPTPPPPRSGCRRSRAPTSSR